MVISLRKASGKWMNPNGTAVNAAAAKMLCRFSSRVCTTPAQAVSSQRLTKMKLINSSRSWSQKKPDRVD
jgi:hypothetical protein